MKQKALLLICAVLVMSLGLVFSASAQETVDNVVDVIAKDGDFDTLHEAIVAAELADTLALASESYTVFAPTDAAFAEALAENPDALDILMADPTGDLASIVNFHVVSGKIMSSALADGDTLTTLQGEELTVSVDDGEISVNDVPLTTVDIPAKNGVIHVIDGLLIPSTVTLPEPVVVDETETEETAPVETPEADEDVADGAGEDVADETADLDTILELIAADDDLSQFLGALEAAGLDEQFGLPGRYTVFAPTNEAIEAFAAGDIEPTLLFHIVSDTLTRDQLATDDIIPTLDGRPLFVNRDGSTILNISGAKVLTFDIQASNGIIHVIDKVMVP